MQSKMTMQSLKTEQSRRSSSTASVNRRQFTVSRRSNTHPYYRNKINSENCYKCDQNEDCFSILNARFARIESLVEDLSKAVKATGMNLKNRKVISPTSSAFGSVDLTKMNIDELLCFSSQLGIRLFNNLDKEKKITSSSTTTPIKIDSNDNKENKENKILKDIENEANATSNDS